MYERHNAHVHNIHVHSIHDVDLDAYVHTQNFQCISALA